MTSRPAQPFAAANSGQAERASIEPRADFRFPASLADAVERCWRKAAAPGEWNLSRAQFEAALARSAAHRFSDANAQPTEGSIQSYLDTLRHADLALACACSAGSEVAWEFFVGQFRQELYRAARAIAGGASAGDSDARELADSLYADLYGLRESEGRRKSLFDYFHGRSKLGTWLRAILAQRHVDAIRRTRKFEPLEDETGRERSEITERAAADAQQPGRARHARRSAIRLIRIARDTCSLLQDGSYWRARFTRAARPPAARLLLLRRTHPRRNRAAARRA